MIQKEKINGYSVIGYDKDNDIFVCYEKCENKATAITKAEKLARKVSKGELKRKCSDGSEEPIDWIEVYWNWNEDDERIIWGSYND